MTELEIESPANPRIKAAVRLRARRARDETGLTLVDGARELRRAHEAGVVVEEAFVAPEILSHEARGVAATLRAAGARVVAVSRAAFERIAFGERADGLVAVIRTPSTALSEIDLPADPLVVVLEGVEKPGNVGAVVRTADGAGANALIAADPRTDLFNPNAIRASLGTIFSVPLGSDDTPRVRGWLEARQIRVVAARVDAGIAPWEADLSGAVALVLGSEAEGLGARWSGEDLVGVRIPMHGAADSLNVSVAAAVMLYEARRQRG